MEECPLPSFGDGPKVMMFYRSGHILGFNFLQNRTFLLVVLLFTDAQVTS